MREWKNSRETEGRPQGAVEPRVRWTDKSVSSLSKCWELSPQSGQRVRVRVLVCIMEEDSHDYSSVLSQGANLWRARNLGAQINSELCKLMNRQECVETIRIGWQDRRVRILLITDMNSDRTQIAFKLDEGWILYWSFLSEIQEMWGEYVWRMKSSVKGKATCRAQFHWSVTCMIVGCRG